MKNSFRTLCLFFFCYPSIIIRSFIGVWRSIPQRRMWTVHIIEIYVFPDSFFEFFHQMIVSSMQFLSFKKGEKGFYNRIVTGLAGGKKGLFHMEYCEQLLESKGGVLYTPVAVENRSLPWTTFFISCSKGRYDELATGVL